MSDVFCPASMCPLVAPKGSPWTGEYMGKCPQHDDIDTDGCPFWSMTCATGGVHAQVEEAYERGGRPFVVGPNQPRAGIKAEKTYDCTLASVCSWQINAGEKLCPPRYAMSLGMDPRVCLF